MTTEAEIGHVSDTALWVAVYRAKESERPDALFKDPYAMLLAGERGVKIAASMANSEIMQWVMSVRTVAIDRLILDAIRDGVDVVVNIGAGLDTRPYRLDLPENLLWIEVDDARIIEMKTQKLANEKPKCRLEHIAIDFSQRKLTQKLYAELGLRGKKILAITEGVVMYLSPEQAGHLADDLKNTPGFRYWIQDYVGEHWRMPDRIRRKLHLAPFLFREVNQLEFFAKHGWVEKENILSFDEGLRLGRMFPFPFPWKYIIPLVPNSKKEAFRKNAGYVLFERKSL